LRPLEAPSPPRRLWRAYLLIMVCHAIAAGCGGSSGPVVLPPPCLAETVASGYSFTMVTKADGSIWATGSEPRPLTWLPTAGWKKMVRSNVVCVLSDAGEARCGDLSLGRANVISGVTFLGMALSTFETTFDSNSNYAIRADGSVLRFAPELGPGVDVPEMGRDAISLEGSPGRLCAVKQDGSLWCMGVGYLGDGTDEYFTDEPPHQVYLEQPALSSVAGYHYACVLLADQTVSCWGQSYYTYLIPYPVGISDVKSLSMGVFHVCALKNDGTLWCWGGNNYGQAGGDQVGDTPHQVDIGGEVTAVSAGDLHTCARRADATIWCWGDKRGFDNQIIFTTPTPTPTLIRGCE
jgi:hypothetical protein